jgi:formamidopyrimidine-DNA glycosylase
MPELPEVETVVLGLRPQVVGRTFTGVWYDWPRQIVNPTPAEFAARLPGQRVIALRRRAKYIVFDLSSGALLIHLKMSGRLYVAEAPHEADAWVHVVFDLDDGKQLRFSDARKFGRLYLVSQAEDVTGSLGPEPLSEAFSLEMFQELIALRAGTIKPLLLNQRFIAGIGNIYADEALWLARIDPRRKANTLKDDETERLYHAMRAALADGIRFEGASVNWYRKPDGGVGDYQNHFNVYDRPNQPCPRCGNPISKITLGQRGTHYCPVCQC